MVGPESLGPNHMNSDRVGFWLQAQADLLTSLIMWCIVITAGKKNKCVLRRDGEAELWAEILFITTLWIGGSSHCCECPLLISICQVDRISR